MRTHYADVRDIARIGESHGLPIYLLADLFPLRVASNRLTYLADIPLLSLSAVPETYGRLLLKRLMDLVLSSALILLLSPAFLLMAAIIKLDSKGPVFFAQERVGRNQRRFKMLKFRSMVVNAEELRKKLEAQNEADGPVFKIRNDPRITRIGRFIRRYSIDEFPQLFNVWMGQMSLVGPRPPIPAEVEEYRWDQRRRLSVTPGMTGLWQVSGRSEIAFEEWVEMDLAYIDSWSLLGDLIILFKTFRAVITHRGAA
jgi:exopolysaccharide biosynthesis polyprenyl glycosylphosphotransferase